MPPSAPLAVLPNPLAPVVLLRDASESGWHIDRMLGWTTAFVSVLFVLGIGWMLWSVVTRGPKRKAVHDHGADFKSWRWTALAAAATFAIVDGDLLVNNAAFLFGTVFDFQGAEAAPGAVRIEVNAHQWAWAARYPGPDGKFNTLDDIVVLNELVVPQGVPVIFQVTSTDVVHGFNVPNMRMKVDAIPGTVTRMWFQPKDTGVFEIVCAQHCGANHYKMRGTLSVLPVREFQRWATVNAENAARAFDPQDVEAHWGWEWAEHSSAQ
jgi:cytochrome c oxidase subunit II